MSIDDDKVGPEIGLPDPDSDPAHARMRAAIGETGAALAPRAGWEKAVWARIEAEGARAPDVHHGLAGGSAQGLKLAEADPARRTGPSRRAWWLGGGALAAAAALLLVLQPWRGAPDRGPAPAAEVGQVALAPSITFRSGPQAMRSASAAPGDTMVVRQAHAAARVWVYLDGALHSEGGAAHELVLERPGTYHVISVAADRPAPTSLDDALASLLRDTISHRRDVVDVR